MSEAADCAVVIVVAGMPVVMSVRDEAGRQQGARQEQRHESGRPARSRHGSGVSIVVVSGHAFRGPGQSSSTMVMAFQLFIGMSSRFRFES